MIPDPKPTAKRLPPPESCCIIPKQRHTRSIFSVVAPFRTPLEPHEPFDPETRQDGGA